MVSEIIYNENGEVRYTYNPLTEKVININQSEGYKKKLKQDGYKDNNKGKNWVACYHEPIKRIISEKKLELHELGALLKLITYLQFKKDGLLLKEGQPMTIDDMAEIIGKKRRQTQDIIRKLANVGIITNIGNNRKPKYVINKKYHSIGEIGEGMFTQLYQVKTRTKAKDITLHEAGLLYKLLPWFHYEECYLCLNPNEKNPEEIYHLNQTELSKLIGEDERTVRTHMGNLIKKGFIMKTESYGAVNYIVNPNIMYSQYGGSDYIEFLRKQFNELERTSLFIDNHIQ